MKKRIISANLTFFNKILGFPFILFLLLYGWRGGYLTPFYFIYAASSALSFLWSALRLKRVSVDDEHLYVTNFLKGVVIPLSEIEAVTPSKWYQPFSVTIHLSHQTEFGNKIVFMPKGASIFSTPQSIGKQLMELAEEARRRQLPGYYSHEPYRLALNDEQRLRDTSAR